MVQCPYCQHAMQVKGLNPGSFYIRCSGCAKQFPVTVASTGAEPVVGMPAKPAAVSPIGTQTAAPAAVAPAAAVASPQVPAANPHRLVADLDRLVQAFHGAPSASIRVWAIRGLQIGTGVVVLGFAAAQLWWWAVGFAVCMALAWVLYEVLAGLSGGSYLYKRATALLFASGLKEWARLLVGVVLIALAVFVLDLIPMAATLTLLALGIAAGLAFGIDRALASERAAAIADAREMLKRLRLAGANEEAIRKFVCEFGGDGWEEFYETLFGYESKLDAREKWGRAIRGSERREYAAWRDPIAAWLNRRLELARERREQQMAEPVNAPAPAAVDVKPATDEQQVLQARRMAELMTQQAEQIAQESLRRREQALRSAAPPAHPAHPAPPPPPVPEVVEHDASDDHVPSRESYLSRRYGGPLSIIFAPRLRFFIAAILLVGFLMWRYENRAAFVAEVGQIQQQDMDELVVLHPPTEGQAKDLASSVGEGEKPLRIRGIPDSVCDTVGSWPGGTAGLILLISSFMESWLCGLMMYIAAGLALFGANVPLVQEFSGGRPRLAAIVAGAVLALLTFAFKRRSL